MKTAKVSVSLPIDLLEEARRRTGGENLSAYISAGLRRQLRADRLGQLLDEFDEEFGPPSAAELAQAREWLAD